MTPTDPAPDPDPVSPRPPDSALTGGPTPAVDGPRPPGRSLWAWALAAAALAGLASWAVGERVYKAFDVGFQATPLLTMAQEGIDQAARKNMLSRSKEGAATFGTLGALTGLALGLAAGLGRRDLRSALTAAAVGLILGGAAGSVAGLSAVRIFYRNEDLFASSLIFPMLAHGAVWAAIGVAAGIAFGVGLGDGGRDRGRIARAAAGGLLGAVGATLLYELAGAMAFPFAKTHFPIAESSAARLLAHLAVPLLIAACVAGGAPDSRADVAPR